MTTLDIQIHGPVARVFLNRPEVRNAFNDVMAEEVQAALKSAERDENIRCRVITGAGQSFCVGQDLAAIIRHAGAGAGSNTRPGIDQAHRGPRAQHQSR